MWKTYFCNPNTSNFSNLITPYYDLIKSKQFLILYASEIQSKQNNNNNIVQKMSGLRSITNELLCKRWQNTNKATKVNEMQQQEEIEASKRILEKKLTNAEEMGIIERKFCIHPHRHMKYFLTVVVCVYI